MLLDHAFDATAPDVVVVQGDTNTTVAAALAANARTSLWCTSRRGCGATTARCPRSTTASSPTTSPTSAAHRPRRAAAQLAAEGIAGPRVVVTGNTVVDAAATCCPDRAGTRRRCSPASGWPPDGFVLSTFHRPENVDDAAALAHDPGELGRLPRPVVLPLHPRTAARLDAGRRRRSARCAWSSRSATASSSGWHANARSSSRTRAGSRRRRAS